MLLYSENEPRLADLDVPYGKAHPLRVSYHLRSGNQGIASEASGSR